MAEYHFTVKVHGRQGGKHAEKRAATGRVRIGPESSVSAAAYRSGNTLTDERTGLTHRYSRADRVKYTEIVAPKGTPEWAYDRQNLWNSVERRETRRDSQLFREIEVALPIDLNLHQQVELLRGWIAEEITPHGAVADVAIHVGKDRNPHAHIMVTTRALSGGGWSHKLRQWEAKGDEGVVQKWRASWSKHANRALAAAGCDARIDHRSLAEQDADLPEALRREPTMKVGPGGAGKSRDLENQRRRERNAAKAEAAARFRADRERLAREGASTSAPDEGLARDFSVVAAVTPPVPNHAPSPSMPPQGRERTLKSAPAQPKLAPQRKQEPETRAWPIELWAPIAQFWAERRRRKAEKKRMAEARARNAARKKAERNANALNKWREAFEEGADYGLYPQELKYAAANRENFLKIFEPVRRGLPVPQTDDAVRQIMQIQSEVSRSKDEERRKNANCQWYQTQPQSVKRSRMKSREGPPELGGDFSGTPQKDGWER